MLRRKRTRMARRKPTSRPTERLFADSQKDLFEKSYGEKLREEKNMPVECLNLVRQSIVIPLGLYAPCTMRHACYSTGAIFAMSLLLYALCFMLFTLYSLPYALCSMRSVLCFILFTIYYLLFPLCSMPYALSLCAVCFLGSNSILLFMIF